MAGVDQYFIYREGTLNYVILRGGEWPWGTVVAVRMTLRGARRVVARDRRKRRKHGGDRVLIETNQTDRRTVMTDDELRQATGLTWDDEPTDHEYDAWVVGEHLLPDEFTMDKYPYARDGMVFVHDKTTDEWSLITGAMFARWYEWA